MTELGESWARLFKDLSKSLYFDVEAPHARRLDIAGAADMSPFPPGMKELR